MIVIWNQLNQVMELITAEDIMQDDNNPEEDSVFLAADSLFTMIVISAK